MDLIQKQDIYQSWLLTAFTGAIEWGNRWLTLSGWLFKKSGNVFIKLEGMIFLLTLFTFSLLFWIDLLPYWAGLTIAILLVQRVVEFVIVYSRNFILNRGRIYSEFADHQTRGQWLLLMFSFNILQLIFVFSIWYYFISLKNPAAFSAPLSRLDSVYYSIVTFSTIGYGEIVPLAVLPKLLVITQAFLFFFIIVVVINGLISLHFSRSK